MVATLRYQDSDRPLVTSEDFGKAQGTIAYPESYFRWQFEENPLQIGQPADLWICKDDGRIVGQMAGIPARLQINNCTFAASWIHDLLVHPEFRGRGIAHQLGTAAAGDHSIVLGLGMGEPTARVFYRLGCLDFGLIPVYVRPLRCDKIIEKRFGRTVGRGAGALGNAFFGAWSSLNSMIRPLHGLCIEEIEQFDQRADELWRTASRYYPVLCVRDAQQLNWRFASTFVRTYYRRFVLMEGDRAIGYVVFSREIINGIDAVVMVDFLCEPRHRSRLFLACIRLSASWGATALYCTHLSSGIGSVLGRLGFIRRRRSGKWFIASARGLEKDAMSTLERRTNWFVTLADSDAHRPGNIRGRT